MKNEKKAIDLGLPSGLLWATCNVGANSPEDYGDYYAWGVYFYSVSVGRNDFFRYYGQSVRPVCK